MDPCLLACCSARARMEIKRMWSVHRPAKLSFYPIRASRVGADGLMLDGTVLSASILRYRTCQPSGYSAILIMAALPRVMR